MIPVMIVEDEFLVRAGLKISIDWEREGFEIVAEAKDGREALEMYRKYHPAIVITDIRMPGLDGIAMMKEIRMLSEDVSFIVISAYDDFQYAKEAIGIGVESYLLKGSLNGGELLAALSKLGKKHSLENREKSLKIPYTLKELYTNPELLESMNRENGETKASYLMYFQTKEVNLEMLDAMILDFFQHSDIQGSKLKAQKGNWFLYTVEEDGPDTTVEELARMFDRYLDEKVMIAKSRKLSFYRNAEEAIYYVLLLHENQKHPWGKKERLGAEEKKTVFQEILRLVNELLNCLKFQKYEEAHRLLQEIRKQIVDNVFAEALFESVYRIMGIYAEQDEDIVAARVYKNIMRSMDVDYIFQTMEVFIDNQKERKVNNSNVYILKVKEYVEQNYHEPIQIRDLSEYIHVSPNYLGKIFFLNTGEHLKDYINTVKMEKAGELLMTKKYQVNEVADMVGMNDQRYFAKLFKKHFGVSPTKYLGKNDEI